MKCVQVITILFWEEWKNWENVYGTVLAEVWRFLKIFRRQLEKMTPLFKLVGFIETYHIFKLILNAELCVVQYLY